MIVCVGYLYGASLAWAADQYPNVKFIAVDVTQGDIGTDTIPANCYCITFKEEQAGYLAGYAIAKDGKTKLGFLGGMAVPAVIRYGYGFVQGADAAAQELGRTSRSTTSTAASSTAMPTSPPVWRAGTPTALRSCLPAAAASPPLWRLL